MESINWGFNAALAVAGFVLAALGFTLLFARKCDARYVASYALMFSCLFALASYAQYRDPDSSVGANELLQLNHWAALSCDGVEFLKQEAGTGPVTFGRYHTLLAELRVKADQRAFSRQESRAQGKSDACEKAVS